MPTFLYNRLAAILLQEQQFLQEAPLNPQQMKTKLGIKAIAISDEDMQSLMDVTEDKKQLVALVRYAQETKNLLQVIAYGRKMVELDPKLDPQRFTTFTEFTNHIDAKVPKQKGPGFDLDSQPADWQSQDGRYRLYKAHGRQDCIKYGHGNTFCISRTAGGNLFHHYRSTQQSQFYFCFDTSLGVNDETYITVVDAHPGGKFEFTHKSNDTPTTSAKYGYKLDNFLRTKPGLEAGKAFFQPKPITPEEKEEKRRWFEVAATKGFAQLNREEKLAFISNGENPIHGEQLKGMDAKLQNEFVSIFGSRLYEEDLQYFIPGQQVRIIADMLEEGYAEYGPQMMKVIETNVNKFYFRLAHGQEEAPQGQGLVKWNSVMLILQALANPLAVLQRYPGQAWKESFETTIGATSGQRGGHLSQFCMNAKNLPAIEAYVPSPIFRQGVESISTDQLSQYLQKPNRKPEDAKQFSRDQWVAFGKQSGYLREALRSSRIAFDMLQTLAEAMGLPIEETWRTTAASRYSPVIDTTLMNVILTSPDPLAVSRVIPFHDPNVIANMSIRDLDRLLNTVERKPQAKPFVQELIKNGSFPEEMFGDQWWSGLSQDNYDDLKRLHQKYLLLKQDAPALNERYLNRFKKILNS